MEYIKFTLSEIHRTLTSINAYLTAFAEEIENKKKKVNKKKNQNIIKKRNLYSKKKDGTLGITKVYADEMSDKELYYYQNMAEKFPMICTMDECLLYEEYNRLCADFSKEAVQLKIEALGNSTKIYTHISAYKTLRNWLNRDKYARRYS